MNPYDPDGGLAIARLRIEVSLARYRWVWIVSFARAEICLASMMAVHRNASLLLSVGLR